MAVQVRIMKTILKHYWPALVAGFILASGFLVMCVCKIRSLLTGMDAEPGDEREADARKAIKEWRGE